MSVKPILFNTEMVQAILDGRKTVTRRVANINPDFPCSYGEHEFIWDNFTGGQATGFVCRKCGFGVSPPHSKYPCGTSFFRPRYFPGDILYVRETWKPYSASSAGVSEIEYKAGGIEKFDGIIAIPERNGRWHPSIHMPKEAARLFLRVADVRVERLQDIEDDGIFREGACLHKALSEVESFIFRSFFVNIWNDTVKKADLHRYSWGANPWVWVIEFERISKEAALEEARDT